MYLLLFDKYSTFNSIIMEDKTYEKTKQKAEQVADTVNEKSQKIGDTVNQKAEEIGDVVKEKVENADAKEWMGAISEILEKLTEKHPKVSLECNGVSFETEKPDDSGNIMPEGKIKIDGKFTLSLD